MMPQQPLAVQPAAPLPMTHPQPSTMYPSAPGAPQQPAPMGPRGAHAPPTHHMIQPAVVGPPAAQQPTAVRPPPSPSPSPSPSPGPTSLSLNSQQRTTPAPTPAGAAPPTLPTPSAVSPSTSLFQRQNSSTDDLLSSSPESQPGGPKAPTNVLQPTKADPQDGERRKKNSQGVLLIQGDPYQAPERVTRLHGELERFRAQVDSLEHPTEKEGGLSVLDARWKELQDQQEKDARQLSIAIARCYTMKNRHQDVMPYDLNRVVLQSGKDDYINSSYVEDLSPYCPRLIATQAPLSGTAADFWLMVFEQKVSLIVMLVSEQELEKVWGRGLFCTGVNMEVIQMCVCVRRVLCLNESLFFLIPGKGRALLPDGARPAGRPGADHAQPHHAEDDADARGAHDQPAVPRPEPEAHRRPPAVHRVAGAVRVIVLLGFFFFFKPLYLTRGVISLLTLSSGLFLTARATCYDSFRRFTDTTSTSGPYTHLSWCTAGGFLCCLNHFLLQFSLHPDSE